MKRFFSKLFTHGLLVLLLSGVIITIRYTKEVKTSKLDLSTLPDNFISNSVCFNTKLEHAKADDRLIRSKTIVLGSSMALNNISGNTLSAQMHDSVYNLASWGLKPAESYKVLKQIGDKITAQHLIVPFNHTEFGNDSKSINYENIGTYLSGGNIWQKLQQYLANFTVDAFVKDWIMRTNFLHRSNSNLSLNFDNTGAVMCDKKKFVFDKSSRQLAYQDTTGFHQFVISVDSISKFCDQHNIKLTLVYLPWKREVITADKHQQVRYVANYMARHYPNHFIDLSEVAIPSHQYFDAGHMFEGGAAIITHTLADSLKKQNESTQLAEVRNTPYQIEIPQ